MNHSSSPSSCMAMSRSTTPWGWTYMAGMWRSLNCRNPSWVLKMPSVNQTASNSKINFKFDGESVLWLYFLGKALNLTEYPSFSALVNEVVPAFVDLRCVCACPSGGVNGDHISVDADVPCPAGVKGSVTPARHVPWLQEKIWKIN